MTKKTDKRWFAKEIKDRSTLSWAHNYTGVPGCQVIEAVWNKAGYPIGTLWFVHSGAKTIDIVSLYVINHYRRLGVANYLLEKLIESYPETKAIITGEGTEFSTPWLKKNGFKRDNAAGWRKDI